jgi:hypothetical protein
MAGNPEKLVLPSSSGPKNLATGRVLASFFRDRAAHCAAKLCRMTARPTLIWICAANFRCLSFEYFARAARTKKRGSYGTFAMGSP